MSMYSVYVRLSQRTGNPEVWAYHESGVSCKIVYGSLITGGLTNADKTAGYSMQKSSEKISEGYVLATRAAKLTDISDAKTAVKGSRKMLSNEAFAIYSRAMGLLGRNPDSSLRSNVLPATASSQSTTTVAASTKTSKASTPKKSTSSVSTAGFVSKDEANSSWAW
jgi:hypothetical protein